MKGRGDAHAAAVEEGATGALGALTGTIIVKQDATFAIDVVEIFGCSQILKHELLLCVH